jgi:predicted nucleotidyltransferase
MPDKVDNRSDIIACLKSSFDENAEHFSLEMAFLYGSRAEGVPGVHSDVDIAVEFSNENIVEEDEFDCINTILLSLTSKLGKEVNILVIYKDFRKPMLYYNAIVHGVPVFFKNFDGYADIRNEAIFQMEDFSIFGTQWQIQVARKNLEEVGHD